MFVRCLAELQTTSCKHEWLPAKSEEIQMKEIQDENEIIMYAQIDRDVTTCGVSRYHA